MSIGPMHKVQIAMIVRGLQDQSKGDRVEMFAMILDQFCLFCGNNKAHAGMECPTCGSQTTLVREGKEPKIRLLLPKTF